MGARIAGAGALAVGLVAGFYVDGNAGVDAAVDALDHVQEPGLSHGRWPEQAPGGCVRGYFPRALGAERQGQDRGRSH